MAIPTTVHQLWKTADVPAKFTALRETWRRRNPSWDFRLWTDQDLDDLVATRYPELLAMFRGYAKPICRADLGRYLVLEAVGGVYADLDCECLRPLAPLLAGLDLAMAAEPEAHSKDQLVVKTGLDQILCPSFIASAPGHPYWRQVRDHTVEAFGHGGVLDQTGPFLLTRAYHTYRDPAPVTVLAAALIYPFTKFSCWDGSVYDLETWERCSREAFVAHYWDGAWFRKPNPMDGPPLALPAKLSAGPATTAIYPEDPAQTRISCLCTTVDWSQGLSLAIESYRRQTHPNKELIIACPGVDARLAEWLKAHGRPDIRLVAADASLGSAALRDVAAQAASGAVLCRWDASHAHDPQRLEIQFRVLTQARAGACVLARRLQWRPARRQMAITDDDDLSTLMVEWAYWPPVEMAAASILRGMAERARVVSIDLPRLTLRVAGEGETAAFEAAWAVAATRFEGERCEAVAEHIAQRLPIAQLSCKPVETRARPQVKHDEILVLTPIKDGRRHLPRYLELLSRLDGGGAPLSVAFLEGDSRDGSFEALEAALPSLTDRFSRVEAFRHDDGFELKQPRWVEGVQRQRRAILAKARNRLLAAALGQAAWVLWLDVDVIDYPTDLLTRLRAAEKDIVVPHCVLPDGRSFDINTFIFAPGASGHDDPKYRVDGLYQPPRGEGRLYLEDVADQTLVRVDSVGGTALLVRGDLHREGLNFPAYSYGGYIETEGLAMMARDMGHTCWALPQLRIVHPDPGDGA